MKEGQMKKLEKLFSFFSLILFLFGWQLIVTIKQYPRFILPSPKQVLFRFISVIQSGTLFYHTKITLEEILFGLLLGFSFAFILGYFLAKSRSGEQLFSPLIVGFQAIPVLALAPLLIIWFGSGIMAKIVVCALTLFFPVLINTIVGFRNVNKELDQLMRSLEANFFQKLIYLELPSSLPILFGGLKIGVTLSVIGAVVGEFVGADRGLGFLINLAGGLYDTPLRFVAFFSLSFIALSLYKTIEILEKKLIKWR